VTHLRRLVLLTLCALVLGACEIRTYLDIDMADVANGTVSLQVGFDDQFRDAMEEFGGGTDLLGELETDAPGEDWLVERFEDGDIEGVKISKEFTSLAELQQIVDEALVSGPQEGLITDVSFTDDDGTIRFEAEVPEGGGFEGMDPADMQGLFTYDGRISVTFPGEVTDHNGELIENTVTWSFDDPAAMAGTELFAEARKSSGFPWVPIIGVLLGLGVIGLVVWQVMARRQSSADGLITSRLEHHSDPAPDDPVQPSTESA